MPVDKLTNVAKEDQGTASMQSFARRNGRPVKRLGRFGAFVLMTVVLVLCFGMPLYHLVQFAAASELYSYILLVPFVSLYLVWLKRRELPLHSQPARKWAALCLVAGSIMLTGYWFAVRSSLGLSEDDRLAWTAFSFLLFFLGSCCLLLGKETVRVIAFPIVFLVFIVPLPTFLSNWIETFFQHTSATAAYLLFQLSGTPVFRHEQDIQLPGFSMVVAPECSGIRSSMVLFLTSLLAGHLFLPTPWKRAVLTLAVIPLAIVRNGLRIFTIGQLCVQISPEMIHSPIHRQGGPLFFVLSLVPFFLLLVVLRKSDRAREKREPKHTGI